MYLYYECFKHYHFLNYCIPIGIVFSVHDIL